MGYVISVVAAYVAMQMISDITSLKIVMLAGFSIDAGTFFYPITFTLRDLVHKTVGARGARLLIVLAALINVFMAFAFWFTARLPGDPSVGAQTAYAQVLSPVWRIVFASIAAEVLSELVDTEAYAAWERFMDERWQWGRVLLSNAVSVPLDSAIFVTLAFLGTMPASVVLSIFWANVLLKAATTLISVPLIYLVPSKRVSWSGKE